MSQSYDQYLKSYYLECKNDIKQTRMNDMNLQDWKQIKT